MRKLFLHRATCLGALVLLAWAGPSMAQRSAVVGLADGVVGASVEARSPEPPGPEDEFADEFADEFGDEFADEPVCFADPLERLNRGTLVFNRQVDRWLMNPISATYRFLVPGQARRSVRRAFANVNSTVVFANDLLQREWRRSGVTATRFGINSTLGVVGLFDPAASFGFEGHHADFGQTLALEGVPAGAYVVVPLLGPTNVRDGIGDVVDLFFRPTTFLLGPIDLIFYATLYGGGYGLATHEAVSREVDALEESSVDFYAALRSAVYQNRMAEVWDDRDDYDSLTTLASGWVGRSIGWGPLTASVY